MLNAAFLFIETWRRQIQEELETVSPDDIPDEIVQQTGEYLGIVLGKVLENRQILVRIVNRWEV